MPDALEVLELSGCRISLAQRWVRWEDGRELELTSREAALLQCLWRAHGAAVPREELLVHVFGYHRDSRSRAIDSAVARLRKKIEVQPKKPRHLRTLVGLGYKLEACKAGRLERRGGGVQGAPVFFGPLLGRSEVLDAFSERIESEQALCLTGLEGIGKSRLAWALAQRCELPLRYVDLSGARRDEDAGRALVQGTLGRGLSTHDDQILSGARQQVEAHGPVLWLLDNADDLDLGPLLDTWRAAAPAAKWLLTSRRALGLERVPDLAVPPLDPQSALALLQDSSAEGAALARALGYHPLALELAAQRLGVLPAKEMLARTALERLELLSSNAEQKLWHLLERCWDRLSQAERDLLGLLHLLRGAQAVSLEAVLGVGVYQAMEGLRGLSLIHLEGERWRALPLLEGFMEAQVESRAARWGQPLVLAGEALRERHRRRQPFGPVHRLEDLEPSLLLTAAGGGELGARAFALLHAERGCIPQALVEPVLSASLPTPLFVRVRLIAAKALVHLPDAPALGWLEAALLRAQQASMPTLEAEVLLALGALGNYFESQTDPIERFEDAIALAEGQGLRGLLPQAWFGLGNLQHHRGQDPTVALAQCVRASQLEGDDWSEARALLLMAGRAPVFQAQRYLVSAEPIFWRYGDRESLSQLIQRQATLATYLDDHGEAYRLLQEGWSRLWPDTECIARAWLEIALAALCLDWGEVEAFYTHNQAGLRLARRNGSTSFEAHSLLLSSRAAMLEGDRAQALSACAMALALPLEEHPTRRAMLDAHDRLLQTWCGRPTPLGEGPPWDVPYQGEVLVLRALHAALLGQTEDCRASLAQAAERISTADQPLRRCIEAVGVLVGGAPPKGTLKWVGQAALVRAAEQRRTR